MRKGLIVRPLYAQAMIAISLCGAALLGGCEDQPLSLTYDRPAEYQIPQSVKRIAIAEFGAASADDRKYGDIAADQLASQLDEFAKQYGRFELVDRKRLAAILEERDMQLAIGDSGTAAQVGKLANVEAMIYGTVTTSARDEQASKMSIDFASRSPKTVHYTKRYCMASVNFTMDDVRTGKTLASVTVTREYDSDQGGDDAKKIAKTLGFGGDDQPPADQILNRLIADCVTQFVQKVSPHSVSLSVKMEKGKTKIVATGNKLARAGDLDEAAECYRRGLSAKPDDDGAMFNLGLVCEARGDLTAAEEWYSKAFAMKDNEKYILARKRVRMENGQ